MPPGQHLLEADDIRIPGIQPRPELAGGIATSGTYERGEHLIDPHSGRRAARAASASVTGPDLGLADALATAVAVAGEPGLALVDELDGYEAFVINPTAAGDGHGDSRSPGPKRDG